MNTKYVLAAAAGFIAGGLLVYGIMPVRVAPMDHSTMSMGDTMASMTASLTGKTGEALEEAFLVGMIEHHEGAIEMAKALKAGTTRPELLKMADDIVAVQSAEIAMMQEWLRAWFGK